MITLNCEHMTASEFAHTLRNSEPGATFVYFTGDLAHTKHNAGLDSKDLLECAAAALAASQRGDVMLTQRRLDYNRYEYRATLVRAQYRIRKHLYRADKQPWSSRQAQVYLHG